ncbi:MAG: hypothetical protein IJW24_03595, partial [Clostridia bacterium]|nr:hypothetical protein [Clostridia bacterium]
GWTSIKNSISKSLNVPAVKTLSYVGVDKAKNFANKLGIDFEPEDNHLALALGGFTKGTTVKEIADAYACFANSGQFSSSSFIQKIVGANGKILYSSHSPSSKAMSEETAYMITDCLMDAAKNGTAKKIMSDGIKIASKTGTTNSNKDAWSASYTKDYTVVTWIGNLDSSKLSTNIKGSSYPTMISRDVFKNLYANKTCPEFEIPDGIIFAELSSKELEETKLNLAHSQNESKEHVALFTIENLPDFSIQASQIELSLEVQNAKNKPPKLQIAHKNAEKITILRENNNKTQKIKEIINPENNFVFEDKTAKNNNLYTYFITAKKGDQSVTSDKIKIRTF